MDDANTPRLARSGHRKRSIKRYWGCGVFGVFPFRMFFRASRRGLRGCSDLFGSCFDGVDFSSIVFRTGSDSKGEFGLGGESEGLFGVG